ncbi:MAG: formylglycine-generating enzyme family protein [Cyanobacteria bacterium J06648_16]
MATATNTLTLYRYECTNDSYSQDLGDGVTLTLMLVPSGTFMMGAPPEEEDSQDAERPQHRVQLSQFLMGRYPVTQAQWRVVAGYDREQMALDPEPSGFKGDDLPVEQVSWREATEFCQRLSRRTGKHYHLPSEAQWEYACRAETMTTYHFGPQLTSDLANYGRQENKTTAVGQYPPNRWGLHDMHGNVWEWCQDHWHNNYDGAPTDGRAWIGGSDSSIRVRRGGSWYDIPWYCRSASRYNYFPDIRDYDIGFRVVSSAPRSLQ